MAKIILWEKEDFKGKHLTLTDSDKSLVNNVLDWWPPKTWNDKTSSIEVIEQGQRMKDSRRIGRSIGLCHGAGLCYRSLTSADRVPSA